MAHFKRKRPRASGCGHYSRNGYRHRFGLSEEEYESHPAYWCWFRNYPRCHDKTYHTRPTRRKARMLERQVLRGEDPDNMVWPDGRKPHTYYW